MPGRAPGEAGLADAAAEEEDEDDEEDEEEDDEGRADDEDIPRRSASTARVNGRAVL